MDRKRQIELDQSGIGLTQEEFEQGWHWCNDWDGMLVGPGCDEALSCHCDLPAIIAYQNSDEVKKKMETRYPPVDFGDDALGYFKSLEAEPEENTDA